MNLPKAKVIIILFFLLFLSGCAPKNEVVFHVNNTTFTEQFIDEVIELPDNPTRIGYRFMGWYLDENTWEEQILSDYKITDDMDIFAYFEKEYVVEFYVDGEIFHTDYVIDGEQISLPNNPTDQSYEFIGWYEDESLTEELNVDTIGIEHEKNYTLYAYTKKVYTEDEIYNLLRESVFKVEILDKSMNVISQGSGFFIKEDGTFVTNAHVVEEAWYGRIDEDLWPFDKEIEIIYEYNDLSDYAVLKIKNFGNLTKYIPVTFSNDYSVGDIIYSIGYPLGSWVSQINSGKILNVSNDYISTDAYINYGSSGGVTVNNHGEVIGMTTAKLIDGTFGSIPAVLFENYSISYLGIGESLQEYFHPAIKIRLNSFNFETYFNLDIDATVSYDSYFDKYEIVYDITVVPYGDYELSDFSSYIYLSIGIDTNYTTFTESYYGSKYFYDRTEFSYVYLYLYEFSNFSASKTQTVTIYDTFDNIYSIDTYDVDINIVTGSIKYYPD